MHSYLTCTLIYGQAWVVERMGKFHRILDPGLNLLIPIVDSVKYVQSLKEIAIDVPKQSAITSGKIYKILFNVDKPKNYLMAQKKSNS